MDHACDIEWNFRKQEITDDILEAEDDAKQYLPDKQSYRRNKVGLGNSL